MGVFEMEAFAKGTFGIAHTLANLSNKVCAYEHGATHSLHDFIAAVLCAEPYVLSLRRKGREGGGVAGAAPF